MLRALFTFLGTLIIFTFIAMGGLIFVLNKYGSELPDYHYLGNHEPDVMTRVHAGDVVRL